MNKEELQQEVDRLRNELQSTEAELEGITNEHAATKSELLAADTVIANLKDRLKQAEEELAAQKQANEALAEQLAAQTEKIRQDNVASEAVRQKMALGLTREQAEQVVKNQAEHDAKLAKENAQPA